MFGDSDLGVFFDPGTFGVPVAFAGATATGILDTPQAIRLADRGFGGFSAELPTLQLPYNAFDTMPVETDIVNVNYQDYSITERQAHGDGAIFLYSLKVAP